MVKLRIALVVNNLDVGGLEKVVISLIRGLDRNRFEVFLICLDGPGKLFEEATIDPERCLIIHRRLMRLGSYCVDIRAIWAIRSFIGEKGIQLLHTHNLAPLIYGGIASLFKSKRPIVVYTEHNQINRATKIAKLRFPHYLKLADKIVAVSQDLQLILQNQFRVRKPISVIYNGIDGARYRCVDSEHVRRELGAKQDTFLVGTAVVLSEQKGVRFLLQAAAKTLKINPKIQFVVAGDGPLRHELESDLKTLKMGDQFLFLGYRRDIPEIISALDLYVLSSLWEGLPLALLEALAIGKPIVCTRVGGTPEIIEDGQNGFLVTPGDADDLAAKILSVAVDQSFIDTVRQRNRSKFEKIFSEQAMITAYELLYEKLIKSLTHKTIN